MRQPIIIDFQGVSTHRSGLDDIASMVFTDELGNEFVCMLHGDGSIMDDNRRFLLQTAHEIADMHNRNELRRKAAEFSSVRPSVLDDLDDEDDSVRYTAGDPDDPDAVPEDENLPF